MAEKEYIERDEAYKTINEAMTAGMVDIYSLHQRKADFEEALEVIKQLPTADVQEIVRCKDCKFLCRDFSKREIHLCMRCFILQEVTLKDYCSWGKRMDGE